MFGKHENNTTHSTNRSQQGKFTKYIRSFENNRPNRIVVMDPPTNQFIENPLEFCKKNLTEADIDILNYLLELDKKCSLLFPSQTTIASYSGVTRQYVNQRIKRMLSLGLIEEKKTYGYKTCLYKLSSFFHNIDYRAKLSSLFPALKYLPLFLLFTQQSYGINRNLINISIARAREAGMSSFIRDKVKTSSEKLRLTNHGEARLSIYPDAALDYALEKFMFRQSLSKTTIKKPLEWFITVCEEYCGDNQIMPQWQIYYRLCEAMNIRKDDPCTKPLETKNPSGRFLEKSKEKPLRSSHGTLSTTYSPKTKSFHGPTDYSHLTVIKSDTPATTIQKSSQSRDSASAEERQRILSSFLNTFDFDKKQDPVITKEESSSLRSSDAAFWVRFGSGNSAGSFKKLNEPRSTFFPVAGVIKKIL